MDLRQEAAAAVAARIGGVAVAGDVCEAVRRAKAAGIDEIIVEVDRVDQIEPALAGGATRLLLDNMAPAVLRGAVTLVGGRVPTRARRARMPRAVRGALASCAGTCSSAMGRV